MAINNKPASKYAQPHTMSGKKVNSTEEELFMPNEDPNNLAANKMTLRTAVGRVSAGDPGADITKRDGIEMRGGKAQTKGKMSRGPMA
jgi:hypothetical protein